MTMAKKKKKELKPGDEIKSLTKEELQNMKVKLSIEIPKEDFDRLIKEMLNQNEKTFK